MSSYYKLPPAQAVIPIIPLPKDEALQQEVPAALPADAPKKPPPRPWSRKKIILVSLIAFLLVVVIVLVITLPVVLLRQKHKHDGEKDGELGHAPDWINTPDDPSYHIVENHPIKVISDFPDPGLLRHNGTWYSFGTNAAIDDAEVVHVPVATSQNFLNWTRIGGYDMMPTIGEWELEINHWAPDVIQRDDGKFVLYYSGELKTWKPHHCVGVAVSKDNDPLGPYIPKNQPLACPRKHGGAIDPSPFKDTDGKLYVTYKADGNSVGHGGYCGNGRKPLVSVPIMLQELKNDGVTPVGEPVQILDVNESDGPLVEAPNIIHTDQGAYYLFFSSHCFNSPEYNVKYAHSKSLKGPYTRADRALLQTGDFGLTAPGGATVSPDGTKIVFHANCGTGGFGDGKRFERCTFVGAIDINQDNSTVTMTSLNVTVGTQS